MFSWKTLFYGPTLWALRCLSPRQGDLALALLGRTAYLARRRVLAQASDRAAAALRIESTLLTGWNCRFRRQLAENAARTLARDLLIDPRRSPDTSDRFVIRGYDHIQSLRTLERGVIMLGSHLGPYIAAVHWLYRQGFPLRLLVQRPAHVSRYLNTQFDSASDPHPQRGFFLRRGLQPREAAERILRARSALLDNYPLFLCGDVPWPSGRPVSWFGAALHLQSIWAELAAVTQAPVVAVFARFLHDGRYELVFDPPFHVESGREQAALQHYTTRLENVVTEAPEQCVAYWCWPHYQALGLKSEAATSAWIAAGSPGPRRLGLRSI